MDINEIGEILLLKEFARKKILDIVNILRSEIGISESKFPDVMIALINEMFVYTIKSWSVNLKQHGELAKAKEWEANSLSHIMNRLRLEFDVKISMEGEDEIMKELATGVKERMKEIKNMQSKFQVIVIDDWDFRFPIIKHSRDEEIKLVRSDKTDLLFPEDKLPLPIRETGKQLQLQDEQGQQYWAYFYKTEKDEYPMVIQKAVKI